MTTPGFSSRSQVSTTPQFPMRDEAAMTVDPGFSNSGAVKDDPADVHPEVEALEPPAPGFTNAAPDQATIDAEAAQARALLGEDAPEEKVVAASTTESKTVRRSRKS